MSLPLILNRSSYFRPKLLDVVSRVMVSRVQRKYSFEVFVDSQF